MEKVSKLKNILSKYFVGVTTEELDKLRKELSHYKRLDQQAQVKIVDLNFDNRLLQGMLIKARANNNALRQRLHRVRSYAIQVHGKNSVHYKKIKSITTGGKKE